MRTIPTKGKTNGTTPHGPAIVMPATLDELLDYDSERLAELYAAASVPALADLEGDLRGRLLAWNRVRGLAGAALRALGRWDRFPWRGKSFRGTGEQGDGDNRIFLERFHRYRFETSIGPSRAGAFDAVHLDYDRAENPFFVRAIHDELRQLRPGLYLGQAYLLRPVSVVSRPRLVLYFGLEGPARGVHRSVA